MEVSTDSTKKLISYGVGALVWGLILLLLFWIGDIILPFLIAIFISYLLNPIILKIQKKIKNRNWAVTLFFLVIILAFTSIIGFFGGYIVKDSKRFINAVDVFIIENEQQITGIKNTVVSFVSDIYESEIVQSQMQDPNTLIKQDKELDLTSAITSVYSFFENPDTTQKPEKYRSWSPIMMMIYTLLYTVLIMYTYQYFEDRYLKYISNRSPVNKKLVDVFQKFKSVFVVYFKQRSLVVLLNTGVFILTFTILDLPGAIILGVLTGILSYASHFHYLSLPLLVIACWILSIESGISFFIYFGIVLTEFIIISILDETIYFDKIMNSVNGMNPAIMVLSFVLWIYIFGGFVGTIIALPLTQLILIYIDKLLASKTIEKNVTN